MPNLAIGHRQVLPLVHVTPYSKFRRILKCGYLAPQSCSIFGEELLYCSYGDIVFRPSGNQPAWSVDPPVALVLSPKVLHRGCRFLPFDSGAIWAGRVPWFPNVRRRRLVESFGMVDQGGVRLTAWVDRFFGGSDRYVKRQSVRISHRTEEVDIIAALCGETKNECLPDHTREDMRVISQIECHFFQKIELDKFLVRVCIPAEASSNFEELTFEERRRVETYSDQPVRGNLPVDLVRKIQMMIYH